MITWCFLITLWCSQTSALDPMVLAAKARLQGRHLHNQATAHIHELRLRQPPPPMHTAVLPTFSVSYPRVADPRTLLHVHHHHMHHGGGFHHGGSFHHGGFVHHIPKHLPPAHAKHHLPLGGPGVHMSQTIINNIKARQNMPRYKREIAENNNKDVVKNLEARCKRALPDVEAKRLSEEPKSISLPNVAAKSLSEDLKSNSEARYKRALPLIEAERLSEEFPFDLDFLETLATENNLRYERALPNIAAARLAVDPNVKLDLIGTLDNVREATKDIVEHADSPLYHIRDAMGSARDVLFSIMKMSPTGLLVPTTYRVTQLHEASPGERVGAINPALLKRFHGNGLRNQGLPSNDLPDQGLPSNDLPVEPVDEAHDTLNTVQSMLRDGFRSARNSAQHVGDTVHSVRKAVLSAPKSALKLLLPYLRVLELRKANRQDHLLGAAAPQEEENEVQKFVGVGKLMELVRAAAARDDSGERVAQALPCPKEILRSQSYKDFVEKVKKDLGGIGL